MDVPKYLYHYTSINALGFILKNRTIKFNNLCAMDDIEEGTTFEIGYGKYAFVSSWTDLKDETIEMWKMYSDDMRGVRIRLRSNPFQSVDAVNMLTWNEEKALKYGYMPAQNGVVLEKVKYLPMEEIPNYSKEDFFDIVEKGKELRVKIGDLGKWKNAYWKFQEEWRYKISFIPIVKDVFYNTKSTEGVMLWLQGLPDLPMKQYFLPIDESAFEDFEILLGPKTNEIDEEIVRLLVNKYNPNAVVKRSKLLNKIR